MNFEDRQYQINGWNAGIKAMEFGKHALLQLPTGAGKAFMAAMIAKILIDKYGLNISILVEQENLVRQLIDTVRQVTGIEPGVVCAGVSKQIDWSRKITVGTRQTAVNHVHKAPIQHVLIADEAHRWKLQKEGEPHSGQFADVWGGLRAKNPSIKLLGFTATPYTLSHGWIFGKNNKAGYQPYFEELTYRTTYKELFDIGKLCIPQLYVTDERPDLSGIDLVGLEYNQCQLGTVMCQYVESIGHAINDHAQGRKHILVFCVNIDHVNAVVEAVSGSVPIHSKLSTADAERNMALFQSGDARVCVSVDQLSIGFDFKAADCAILARPTNSPGLCLQQAGRVLRIAQGKEDALIIDLVGNLDKHLVDYDFDNPIVKVPRASKKTGEFPVKACPGYLEGGEKCPMTDLHAAVRVCPECGNKFTAESIEELMPNLKKVTPYQQKETERMAVESMNVINHFSSKSGKEMLRIVFDGGDFFDKQSVNLYLMFPDYYDGFPVERSRGNWEELTDEEYPETVEEALFLSVTFHQPTEIEYQEKGGFKNVTAMFFGDEKEKNILTSCGDDVPF